MGFESSSKTGKGELFFFILSYYSRITNSKAVPPDRQRLLLPYVPGEAKTEEGLNAPLIPAIGTGGMNAFQRARIEDEGGEGKLQIHTHRIHALQLTRSTFLQPPPLARLYRINSFISGGDSTSQERSRGSTSSSRDGVSSSRDSNPVALVGDPRPETREAEALHEQFEMLQEQFQDVKIKILIPP
ncbi:hypothetical protein Q3G72_010732 [Acer saccharum]|nr:hypothetical protein Q3G72_010732 [Acer saccharum]